MYRTEYVVLRVCLINLNGNTASHEGIFEEVVYVVFVDPHDSYTPLGDQHIQVPSSFSQDVSNSASSFSVYHCE